MENAERNRLHSIIDRQREQLIDYAHTNMQQTSTLFKHYEELQDAKTFHNIERVLLWFTSNYVLIQLTYNLLAMYGSP